MVPVDWKIMETYLQVLIGQVPQLDDFFVCLRKNPPQVSYPSQIRMVRDHLFFRVDHYQKSPQNLFLTRRINIVDSTTSDKIHHTLWLSFHILPWDKTIFAPYH